MRETEKERDRQTDSENVLKQTNYCICPVGEEGGRAEGIKPALHPLIT